MSYRTRFRRTALKELKQLPGHVRAEALDKIEGLAREPRPSGAKELRGQPGFFRLWVATHWRLVYRVDRDDAIVWILRLRRKESIDYDDLSREVHEPAGEYFVQSVALTTVSEDCRVVLSEEICRQVPLQPGDEVRIVAGGRAIILTPARPG